MFYCLPYSIIIRDYCEGFVEFTGQYKNLTQQEKENTSSSTTSSARQMTSMSSTSRLTTIFENEMNMILNEEQIAEINSIMMNSNMWDEDE